MAMTDLSLGALGRAVGANGDSTSETKLAEDGRGSTGTSTAMSAFGISATTVALTTATPNENMGYGNFATGTFTSAGALHLSRIANQAGNFIWTEAAGGGYMALDTSSDYTANCTMLSVSSNTVAAIGYKYRDYFNTNATNYNSMVSAVFTIINTGGGGRSDVRWKQNIERIGISPKGLPIFEFEYINKDHGEGRFRGTTAQELITNDRADATYKDDDGYYWVDYNKIDIKFERC